MSAMTPYLRLPQSASVWTAKPEGWWTLNGEHEWFGEGRPYHGVLHAEVIPRENTTVMNLGVETTDGAQVFSFSFPKNQDNVKTFKDQGLSEHDERKALKIACELLNHLPESEVKKDLLDRAGTRVAQLELTVAQNVWDRF
ncbi:MAG TPA: hypothetical protein VI874_05345 [Candidatus Norongarragalinales archaeon]|nr:hypothetical protein [Candidatus Norongarragalinales archaeon]